MSKRNVKAWLPIVLAASLMVLPPTPGAAAAGEQKDVLLDQLALYELHTWAGSGELGLVNGTNQSASFRQPTRLVATGEGTILVADSGNQRIRQITSTSTSTYAGLDLGEDEFGDLIGAWNDGDRATAAFDHPAGITLTRTGMIVTADAGNHAVRSLNAQGQVSTIAGDGVMGLVDGEGAAARFNGPMDVAVTNSGVIYVADTLNHVIRKIEQGRVTTLTAPSERAVEYFPGAVEPAGDYADGKLAAAKFNEPSGLVLDGKGNLYVSDTGNQLIRYIDFAAGTVSTVAGGKATYESGEAYAEGGYADGQASTARFHAPRGLSLTPEGGLLIADSLNHAIRYLKDGKVHTIAGTPEDTGKADGLAGYAGLNTPTDIVAMGNGRYAIADSANNRIRILQPYQLPADVTADGQIKLLYHSERVATDAEPVIRSGTTFVPVRIIAERLDYDVVFDKSTGQVTVSRGELSYRLHAGTNLIQRGEGSQRTTITLQAAPFIQDDRLYLPVRFFAEEMGLDVQWLPSVRSVLLRERISG
ncbi:stalk domain-containing protein [Paenibacillus daejeonensis]|uniref:stalk domain-containing protein n=1 Tax=Paenibacillus daejeonensis TaxID=135193 RepID=UPI0007C83D3B|nr:stalk domain-containing protein [Paenibacillus daejeonensis]